MLNRLFEYILCGSTRTCTGALCTRWTKSCQGDDGELWKDLTLRNNIPEPRKPPVPQFVNFPLYQFDDVSTFYEGTNQRCRNDAYDPRSEQLPNDLEFQVEPSHEQDEDESSILEVERKFFAELRSTPWTKRRSHQFHLLDDDGSSYSTHRQRMSFCKNRSTDAILHTKNTFTPYLPSTQALI